MTDPASDASEPDLDSAIADVYRGSPEGFVAKRDVLAKKLRVAGRRDDADTVTSLRKPSRPAWALDAVALADPAAVEALAGALEEAMEAQTIGGDVREALYHVREQVRRISAAAAEISKAEGHPVDQAGLVPALSAVIADTEAFEALRAGRLAAIPTGGGVDLLTSLPQIVSPRPRADQTSRPAQSAHTGASTATGASAGTTEAETAGTERAAPDETLAAARRALREAETTAKVVRDRAAEAERALQRAETAAEVADEQLRVAERTARVRREDLEQARQEAEAARTRVQAADESAAHARAELDRQAS